MTTSIFYPSSVGTLNNGSTLTGMSASRACAFNATIPAAMVQQVNATGTGTSMVSGTLSSTPTSGDVLLAVIQRVDNNAVSSNPTGWTLLTGNGNTGRRLEIWWYRSTGIAADKGPFTFSTSAGANRWGIQLFEFGGNAAMRDPVVKTAATVGGSASSVTATTTPLASDDTVGMTLTAIAVSGATLGVGGITTAFSGTGTPESTTDYYDSTFGNASTAVIDLYNNATWGTDTYGTQWTLSASRTSVYAVIQLAGGGMTHSTSSIAAGIGISFYGNAVGQSFSVYDTSAIPDTNVITSASLDAYALSGSSDPTSGDLEVRYYGTSVTNSRGYDNNLWAKSPSAASALTLLATFPASSSFTASNQYTLTNNGTNLASNINKTGNTVLLYTTSDYTSGNGVIGPAYSIDVSGTRAPLTVVHNFAGTATAAASIGMNPTITKLRDVPRTIAATVGVTPILSTLKAASRSLAVTIGTTPTITAVKAAFRSITASVTATAGIVTAYVPYASQVATILRLAGKSTLRLAQSVTVRLSGRSTLRLPKE